MTKELLRAALLSTTLASAAGCGARATQTVGMSDDGNRPQGASLDGSGGAFTDADPPTAVPTTAGAAAAGASASPGMPPLMSMPPVTSGPERIPSIAAQQEDDAFLDIEPAALRFNSIAAGRSKYCGILRETLKPPYFWENGALVCVEDGVVTQSWAGSYYDVSLNDDVAGWDVVCAAGGPGLRCEGFDLEAAPRDAQSVSVSFFSVCSGGGGAGVECFIPEGAGGAPTPTMGGIINFATGPWQICCADMIGHTFCEGRNAGTGAVQRYGHYFALGVGGTRACGVDLTDHAVHCWDQEDSPMEAEPLVMEGELRGDKRALSVNLNDQLCAITMEGALRCSGDGADFGAIEALEGPFEAVSLSTSQACAIREGEDGGDVVCAPVRAPMQ